MAPDQFVVHARVDACPVPKHVCDNVQFADLTVDFFGLPTRPRCVPHQHKQVPGALGKVVGPRGDGLVAAQLRGDAAKGDVAWRMGHGAVKQTLCQLAGDHGAVARVEVYGLFADVFDGVDATPEAWKQVPYCRRVAKVPDVGVTFPGEAERLYEYKSITPCPMRYPPCSAGGAGRAPGRCAGGRGGGGCVHCLRTHGRRVDDRERLIAVETERGLAGIEGAPGVAQGADGPLRERLRGLGGVRGLVGGAFGGGSAGLYMLVGVLAARAAEARWRDMLQPPISHCEGVLRVVMQRELCFAMARARSQVLSLRLARVTGVGSQCGGSWARREDGRYRAGRAARARHAQRNWGWRVFG